MKRFQFSWSDSSEATEYRLLESADGSAIYEEIAVLAAGSESYDLEVFLPARVNAGYILEACNDAGCTASSAVMVDNALVDAIGYIKASNTRAGQVFGFSVAISGDAGTLAVGAPGEASGATGINGDQGNNSSPAAGAVYVFVREADTWTQQAYIKASNTESGDQFGSTVVLDFAGDTLAVGTWAEASGATGINGSQGNNVAPYAGAVYVFTRTVDVWSQQAYVKASNTGEDHEFGDSIALSADGNTMAVGSRGEASAATGINGDQSDTSAGFAGAVYVFTREGTVWTQQAYVKASNTDDFDQFGSFVALSGDGDTLAVGARFESSGATGIDGDQSDNSVFGAGAVYVFTREAGVWSQEAYVKASNADVAGNIGFGIAVALSGDGGTLAVSATLEDSSAVGVNGNQTNHNAERSGAVYVFVREAGAWSQQAYVKASNTTEDLNFGRTLALSADGDTLVVGTPNDASNAIGVNGNQSNIAAPSSGAVYLFSRDAGVWSQYAYVKASNSGQQHYFGYAVALSDDAQTLAVGGPGDSSNATGIGGDQSNSSEATSGAVYLY